MHRSARHVAGAMLVGAFVLAAAGSARADAEPPVPPPVPSVRPDLIAEAPPEVAAVKIDERLGAQIPLDLAFRDQDGRPVTLRELVRGDLPVVLTFNYSSCPMLCSLQLTGLTDALPGLAALVDVAAGKQALRAGDQFRLVTVILEPKEEPARAKETRGHYLAKLDGVVRDGGWTFLVAANDGEDASIRALADAVGFGYHYEARRAEWAHPAALIYLSPTGVITRYVHGVTYNPQDLYDSTIRAGTASPSAAVGFLQRCFHYEPATGQARAGFTIMRIGAGAFAALVLGVVLFAHLRRRARS